MKIAITGHTSGIGKAFAELCTHKNIEWSGFSRSNHYDLTTRPFPMRSLLKAIEDCDVFVNNAYASFAQVDVLYALWDEWNSFDKQIICISSISPDIPKDYVWPYSIHKAALDHACTQLQNIKESKCRVINIKPALVDTPPANKAWPELPKMDVHYMAEVIMWCINQPEYVQLLKIQPRHNA